MKIWFIILIGLLASCGTKKENPSSTELLEEVKTDTIRKSIPKEERFSIGETYVTLKYHSPGVKGRIIWGGLVPMDQVWVTGAHMATSFDIDKDFEVEGTTIPSGKYALFTIPGKDAWIFIINKNWEQHLADEYDAKDDIVRVSVQPEFNQPHQERLIYEIADAGNQTAELIIRWEKIRLVIPFKLVTRQ